MIKEFLEEHNHFKLSIQHMDMFNGSWKVEVYNTTYDFITPIFYHYITDAEMEALNVDFETAIMTPVINWVELKEKKRE